MSGDPVLREDWETECVGCGAKAFLDAANAAPTDWFCLAHTYRPSWGSLESRWDDETFFCSLDCLEKTTPRVIEEARAGGRHA